MLAITPPLVLTAEHEIVLPLDFVSKPHRSDPSTVITLQLLLQTSAIGNRYAKLGLLVWLIALDLVRFDWYRCCSLVCKLGVQVRVSMPIDLGSVI